jgi:Periplasmic binding protein domain
MKLWAAAVNEARSLRQEDVIAALDHSRIEEGPGGPAEMVPGQHHVRMNMYIAQAKNGRFEIARASGPSTRMRRWCRLPRSSAGTDSVVSAPGRGMR